MNIFCIINTVIQAGGLRYLRMCWEKHIVMIEITKGKGKEAARRVRPGKREATLGTEMHTV